MKRAICLFAAAAVFGLAANAHADVESTHKTKDGNEYRFKDDLLDSEATYPRGAIITVRPGAARVMLLRPRASFVPEMLKSVENI
ncbi:MAG: hypothetical protein KC776_41830 [Myxococcales bacterium]|nr:hypothetical protein [Myxococcales bacterium]